MSRRRDRGNIAEGLREKLDLLPSTPGVYLHKDADGAVIYVGKAKSLPQRVRSYFQQGSDHDAKTRALVRRIRDFDYIATGTESEALILENQLIKENRPPYNISLKDDKQYPYLKLTLGEGFPRLEVVRRIDDDRARYFGPYTSVGAMRETADFAAAIFKVRTCDLDLPRQRLERPCLDYQIGRCPAPCVGFETKGAYRRRVRRLIQFLDGADASLLKSLRAEMEACSTARDYEEAAVVRDRITAIATTVERSRPVTGLRGNADVCGLLRDGRDACGVVLRVRGGKILTSHHFLLTGRFEAEENVFLEQLLREYYDRAGDIPAEILVSHELDNMAIWSEWLGRVREAGVTLRCPRRGLKKRLVAMAVSNATYKLRERKLRAPARRERDKLLDGADVALQQALELRCVPETIECFDMSTFQGREAVGSLVFFKRGRPLKSRYRRFRIKWSAGSDDLAMMAECLQRYYSRLVEKEQAPADLVMVDGGQGQLGVAREVLTALGLHEVEVIGLAKREELIHRERGQEPLRLPAARPELQLLQRIRNEAHRFAITYHRLLRDRRTTASILDRIPGIGQVKKLSLLHHFGSIDAIRGAQASEIADVRGLSERDAAAVRLFFDQEETE